MTKDVIKVMSISLSINEVDEEKDRRRRHKIEVDETICTNTGARVIRIIRCQRPKAEGSNTVPKAKAINIFVDSSLFRNRNENSYHHNHNRI